MSDYNIFRVSEYWFSVGFATKGNYMTDFSKYQRKSLRIKLRNALFTLILPNFFLLKMLLIGLEFLDFDSGGRHNSSSPIVKL